MPELPEVETVKRGIDKIKKQKVLDLIVRNPKLRYTINPSMKQQILNQQINKITRRSKYLIIELEKGYIIIHLGMSGSILLTTNPTDVAIKKHDHVDIIFNNNILRYNDPRRFGLIMYFDNLDDCFLLNKLGIEPLTNEFNAEYLFNKINKRKTTIKQLIMDNSIVVGVGNIYACESLFLSNISPIRLGNTIHLAECSILVSKIKYILQEAIKLGGSSLRDHKQTNGNMGYFQNIHNVYGRKNQPCKTCKTLIQDIRLGQRNSFYCPNCQK